jgi:hypothetical protein
LGHIYFDGGLVSLLGFTRVKWSGCTIVHEAAWDGISRVVSVVHRCLSKMALCLEKKISQKILLFAVWMDSDWWGGSIPFLFRSLTFFSLSLFSPSIFSVRPVLPPADKSMNPFFFFFLFSFFSNNKEKKMAALS